LGGLKISDVLRPRHQYAAQAQTLLQPIVRWCIAAIPAQGVGQQTGNHGECRKIPNHAQVVDGLTAKSNQGRGQP